jgi:dTDP-4-amino-4,6-dideoxygalactose transaminase
MILCANPSAAVQKHRVAIDAAIRGVLDGGRYILGEEVAAFEREFADFCGCAEAVGVSSGTDGLSLALAALGIRAGDEVITVSHTAVATVSAIVQLGAIPVLIDIDQDTYTMNPALLEEAITPLTRAIIPVHLYGHPVDMDRVMEIADRHGIPVIEDCSQAHGATWRGKRVGTMGRIGVFSCYPTKNLGAIGDAGVVVTNDPALAKRLRELREYGWRDRYNSASHGVNNRLDELQAAILRVRLEHLEADNNCRRELAARYTATLSGLPIRLPHRATNADPVYHLYVVASGDRDRLKELLSGRGIGCLIHYPWPVHLQEGYRSLVRCPGPLTVTETASRTVLSLPLYPELMTSDQDEVIDALREALSSDIPNLV